MKKITIFITLILIIIFKNYYLSFGYNINLETYQHLWQMYYQGKHNEVLTLIDEYINKDISNRNILLMFKGHILRQLGNPDLAIKTYEEILKSDPNNSISIYYLALCHYLLSNYEIASKILKNNFLEENLNIKHDNDLKRNALYLLSLCYIKLKDYHNAIKILENLNKEFNDFSPYLQQLAYSYECIGNYQKANEYYIKAYKNDVTNFEMLFNAANVALKCYDWQTAYNFYKRIYEHYYKSTNTELKNILDKLLVEVKKINESMPKQPQISIEPKQVSLLPKLKEKVKILVGLNSNEKGEPILLNSIKLKCSGKFKVLNSKTKKQIFTGNDNNKNEHEYELSINNNTFFIKNLTTNKIFKLCKDNIILEPVNEHDTIMFKGIKVGAKSAWESKETRCYRGKFKIVSKESGFHIINEIDLESYLLAVVPSEMPHKYPVEALKAQAICARSETLYKKNILKKHSKFGYDVCDDQDCQMYRGVFWEQPNTTLAVTETLGQILTYNGKVCDAIYSSNAGGYTQSSADISGWSDIKYLKSQSNLKDSSTYIQNKGLNPLFLEKFIISKGNSYCMANNDIKNAYSRWIRIIDAETLNYTLKHLNIGQIINIIPKRRSISGHIDSIEIIGSKGSVTINNELKIRRLFFYSPLRSSKFIIETLYDKNKMPKEFIIYGAGFGHGVGLCQSGAYGLAYEGKNYIDILKHYFHNTEINKLY